MRLLSLNAGGEVLEIGAGCLRNARALLATGFAVTVLEVPEILHHYPDAYAQFVRNGGEVLFGLPKRRRFDLALGTFVFETICDPLLRYELLQQIRSQLRSGGALISSVRGPADLVTATAKGRACSDGFVTPNHTFARSFTRDEWTALLESVGFSKVDFLHKPSTLAPELLHAVATR